RQARAKRRAKRRGARLPELQRAVRVPVDEYALDRDLHRRMRRNDAVDFLEDAPQALAVLSGGPDAAPRHGPRLSADRIDDAEAGDLRARIDTEDANCSAHGPEARLEKGESVRGRTTPFPPASPRGCRHSCRRSARHRAHRARRAASAASPPASPPREPWSTRAS